MRFGVFSVVDHYPGELPRTVAQFYNELLERVELAEELGYESFWVAEHHFHEYGAIPAPPVGWEPLLSARAAFDWESRSVCCRFTIRWRWPNSTLWSTYFPAAA